MEEITLKDLDQMLNAWVYGGYNCKIEHVNEALIDVANLYGLSHDQVYDWTCHKLGRWFDYGNTHPYERCFDMFLEEFEKCFFIYKSPQDHYEAICKRVANMGEEK